MATLDSDFEAKLRAAAAEAIHDAVVDEPDNLAFRFRQQIVENFEAYAARHGYELDGALADIRVTDVDRRDDGVRVRIEGPHPLALFEFGARPHPIEGDPLHWVDEETGEDVFVQHVDHPGLPEARAFRDAIHWLRRGGGR